MHSFAPSLSFLLSFLLLPRILLAADLRAQTAREAALAGLQSLTPVERAGSAPEARAVELELAGRQTNGPSGSGPSSKTARRRHADLSNALLERSNTTRDSDLDTRSPHLLYPGRRAANARFSWFVTGLGACGRTNVPSDFVVALNKEQYDAGDHCFDTVTITVSGKTTQAQIVDRCEKCGYNGLDFTEGLFQFFGGDGIITGDWEYGSGAPSPSPTPTPTPKPTTTSKATPKPSTTSTSTTSSVSTTASTAAQSSSTSSVISTSTTTTPTTAASSDQPQNLQQMYLASLGMGGIIMGSL